MRSLTDLVVSFADRLCTVCSSVQAVLMCCLLQHSQGPHRSSLCRFQFVQVPAVDCDQFCIPSSDKTQVQLNTSWYEYLKVTASDCTLFAL